MAIKTIKGKSLPKKAQPPKTKLTPEEREHVKEMLLKALKADVR